ncbi:low-affinity phosphate transport protein [Escherichia coli]|uniref:Low-affinity phosphate transport protein n=1 Tax=Escherichia coli TaxID=562 RepID=A0A376VVV8_ECOLX|nr:low-affinity phosphate transport protein [Escherichia coli]
MSSKWRKRPMLHLFAGLDLHTGLLLLLALAFVLFYEAINGFHDTANAVATVIYTPRDAFSARRGYGGGIQLFGCFCWVV